MPMGWDDALIMAGISAAGSAASGGLNLLAQSGQQRNQYAALQEAIADRQFRQRQLDQQYELATAGQTDARGNQVRYVPGRGWVTDLTPASQSMLNRSDAVQNQGYVDWLGRGQEERRGAFNRRLAESQAASPLLDAMRYGYGAPSREGVAGAHKVANVTGASEGADQARSGYAAAALRTGSGSIPLQSTVASIDRGATQGIRSALAHGDEDAGPLYEQMRDQFNQGRLNPYNMLASRASNTENVPFNPESISGGLDAASLARSRGATDSTAKGLAAYGNPQNSIIAAMLGQKTPNYDTFVGNLTDTIKPFFSARSNGRIYGDVPERDMMKYIS